MGLLGLVSAVGGTLLGLGGTALCVSAAYYLRRRGEASPVSLTPPKRLVVSGPYAHVQHPMLLGVLCLGLGAAGGLGCVGLGLASVGFAVVAHVFVILREEPALRQRFGEDYAAYQAATPRWFPCPLARAGICLWPRR